MQTIPASDTERNDAPTRTYVPKYRRPSYIIDTSRSFIDSGAL
jgi:hypothetical protein